MVATGNPELVKGTTDDDARMNTTLTSLNPALDCANEDADNSCTSPPDTTDAHRHSSLSTPVRALHSTSRSNLNSIHPYSTIHERHKRSETAVDKHAYTNRRREIVANMNPE